MESFKTRKDNSKSPNRQSNEILPDVSGLDNTKTSNNPDVNEIIVKIEMKKF